jgi:hypothetical protein
MCVTAMVPGLNYFSLAQSHQVLEGKENFYDDYGCGVAVPVGGSKCPQEARPATTVITNTRKEWH